MDFQVIDRVASRQHGLITTTQLRSAGVSSRAIRRAVEVGRLIRVRTGVFRLPGVPVTQDQAWLAAVLGARRDAVLSHESAAAAWGLRHFPVPRRIDLLVTDGRPVIPGVVTHRTISLPSFDRTRLRFLPVTTPERTLVEACAAVPFAVLERSVDDGLRRGLVRLPRLVRTFDAIPVSGRRARVPMEKVLKERVPGFDPGGSDVELDVMRILRAAGIDPLPEQQYRVEVEGHQYRLDYAWPETRHAIELDTPAYHGLVSDFHRDRDRMRRLMRADWTVWAATNRTGANEIVAIGVEATIARHVA